MEKLLKKTLDKIVKNMQEWNKLKSSWKIFENEKY